MTDNTYINQRNQGNEMNSWTTYYHEALARGLNHEESLTLANNLYENDTAVILQATRFESAFDAYDDECSCGRGDGCDCDGHEAKARADEEEAKREANYAHGLMRGNFS